MKKTKQTMGKKQACKLGSKPKGKVIKTNLVGGENKGGNQESRCGGVRLERRNPGGRMNE